MIHPCDSIIDEPVTPQSWGKYSFLGECNFSRDEKLLHHDKGAIYLNPIDKVLYEDELQRLIGLLLQYKLEDNEVSCYDNDLTQAVPICIRCGTTNIKQLEKTLGYLNKAGEWKERTPRSVWLLCMVCKQIQVYNHCASEECINYSTRLIKNGPYWSYHSARAFEPYNIKCPDCGEWGAW